MFPQALGYNTYDAMLDAFNARPDKQHNFAAWYQQQLASRPSADCDHPGLPQVWFDQDDSDDDLMAVNAPKKPKPTNPPGYLTEYAPSPETDEDPKQLVHA